MRKLLVLAPLLFAACDSGDPGAPLAGGHYQNVTVDVYGSGYSAKTVTRTTDFVVPPAAVGDTVALLPGSRIHTTVFTQANGDLSDSLQATGRLTVTRDSAVFLFDRGFPSLVLENGVQPDHFYPEVFQRYAAARRADGSLAWNWGGPNASEQEDVVFERQSQ